MHLRTVRGMYDALLEIFCIRAGLYIYSQVIPFGSVFTGKAYQFPLLWESSLVTVVMIPAAIVVYRDDTGKTVAEKLAQRVRLFHARPALGTFAVMVDFWKSAAQETVAAVPSGG